MKDENLNLVYKDLGVRGERRANFTDLQKRVLWDAHCKAEKYGRVDLSRLSVKKLARVRLTLLQKECLDEQGNITERGRSYAMRFRQV